MISDVDFGFEYRTPLTAVDADNTDSSDGTLTLKIYAMIRSSQNL